MPVAAGLAIHGPLPLPFVAAPGDGRTPCHAMILEHPITRPAIQRRLEVLKRERDRVLKLGRKQLAAAYGREIAVLERRLEDGR